MPKDERKDERIAYGIRCTWWNSIDKVGKFEPKQKAGEPAISLPCCPFCKGMLYEVPNEGVWMAGATKFAETREGYMEFMLWSRGRCFPGIDSARAAYVRETGKAVVL